MDNVLSNIKGFNSSAKLKDAIHCFIATQMMASKETRELKEAFLSMDVNKDGRLDKEEMLLMYSAKMGKEQATTEVEQIMSQVDSDGSGFIDYTEFIAASIDKSKLLSKKNLRVTFQMFDRDGSGTISAKEL
jgi:Ca2+-binding EF-hand superfamily protein